MLMIKIISFGVTAYNDEVIAGIGGAMAATTGSDNLFIF